MPIKTTFFFDFAKSGWSETHYYMAGNVINVKAQQDAYAFAQKRAAILGGPVIVNGTNVGQPLLNWIRMSLDGVFRDSELVTNDQTDISALALTGGPWTSTNSGGVYRNLSLRCRGQTTDLTKRAILYLGGLPDAVFTGDTSYSFSLPLGFQTAWTQFQNAITNGQWGFRAANNSPPVQVGSVTVEAVAPSRLQLNMTGGFTTIGPPPVPVTPVVGSAIQLRNFTAINRAFKPLNGIFYIAAYSANGGAGGLPLITLAGTENRDPTLIFKIGTAELVGKAPVPYTDFFALGPSSRKRGLGLGSPVGRRRPVKQYAD